ncbi:MAG: FAD/NAD(P)-binding protein, partial [Pseudomonadota bacterium]
MEHAKPRTHVVVGDGITAVAFIEHSGLAAGDTLIVLGKAATRLGRGVAYAAGSEALPWRYAYLLNSPADDIDPAFARWLSDRWADVSGTMQGRAPNWLAAAQPLVEAGDIYGVNAPREFYGDFMAEQVAALLAELRARGVAVRLEDACVSALEREGGGVRLFTEDGRSFLADSVDVAPGGPSTLRITGDVGAFSVPTLFGHEARIAEHIRAGAEIFCIGGNAAMLDALRLCQSLIPEADLRFVACAPDGAVPPPLVPRMPRKLTVPDLAAGHETAEAFLQEVWRAIEAARAAGDEMREIRAGFRAYFLEHGLARFVPDQDEARRVPVQLRFWLRG